MIKWSYIVVVAAALLLPCLTVRADELSDLKARVEKLEKGQASSNLDWSADFRYRHESIYKQDSEHYDRDRIRVRVKVVGQVNDDTKLTVRVASGDSQGATSTNQTLGASSSSGEFKKLDLWLDQAFISYTPSMLKGADVYAGKMANPFLRIGGNQLIWDSDVNPDGGAVQFTTDLDAFILGANAGAFWVRETHASGAADSILLAGQLYAKKVIQENTFTGGASFYDFGNMKGLSVGSEGNTNADTTVNTGTASALQNDYELIELFLGLDTTFNDLPVSVFGTWVRNNGTISGNSYDTAYLVGGKINKIKDPGSWQFAYDYRDVDRDAVLGMFTDSDAFDGGTTDGSGIGATSHRFNFAYQLAKNVTGAITYYMSEIKHSGSLNTDYDRLMFDLVVKAK